MNTGSIDAFIRDEISGKLTVEYEQLVGVFPSGGTGAVELSSAELADTLIDGATTMEAGAFLAWSSDSNAKLGIISAREADAPLDSGFFPESGHDYLFRRNITVDGNETKFEYSGYHYDNGKYYKIWFDSSSITSNPTDGTITNAPIVYYVTSKKAENVDVVLTYEAASSEAGSEHGPRLVATYALDKEELNLEAARAKVAAAQAVVDANNSNDAINDLAEAAVGYENALRKYEALETAYNAGTTALGTAQGVVDAANALVAQVNINLANKAIMDNSMTTISGQDALSYDLSGISLKKIITTGTASADEVLLDISDIRSTPTDLLADVTRAINNYNDAVDEINTLKTGIGTLVGDTTNPVDNTINKTIADNKDAANYPKGTLLSKVGATDSTDTNTLNGKINALTAAITELNDTLVTISNISEITENESSGVTNTAALDALQDALTTASSATVGNFDCTAYDNAVTAYNTAAAGLVNLAALATTYDTAAANLLAVKADAEATPQTVGVVNVIDYYFNGADYSNTNTATGNLTDDGFFFGTGSYAQPTTGAPATPTNYAEVADATEDNLTYNYYNAQPAYVADTKLSALKTAMVTAEGEKDTAKGTYDTATATYGDVTAAQTALNNAKSALDAIQSASSQEVKIFINLDENVGTNWTQIPVVDGDDTKAVFYLNRILAAGATSPKLVESVALDGKTGNIRMTNTAPQTFKNLTFDLNVGLTSAQVTYDDVTGEITTDAVDVNFNGTPENTGVDNTDITPVTATVDGTTNADGSINVSQANKMIFPFLPKNSRKSVLKCR